MRINSNRLGAWTGNVAWRHHPTVVPLANPFSKMDLAHKAKPTRPVTYAELMTFVEAADAAGESSIGTAAMIAFFWLQRQEDILTRLTWNHYRPVDAPTKVRIFHHKTGVIVEMPLHDEDGTALWPEIMTRLDEAPRHGTLIVTRDVQDSRRKIHLPWKPIISDTAWRRSALPPASIQRLSSWACGTAATSKVPRPA